MIVIHIKHITGTIQPPRTSPSVFPDSWGYMCGNTTLKSPSPIIRAVRVSFLFLILFVLLHMILMIAITMHGVSFDGIIDKQ